MSLQLKYCKSAEQLVINGLIHGIVPLDITGVGTVIHSYCRPYSDIFLELKHFGSNQGPVVSQLLHSNTSRSVVGVFTVQTPHSCLQDLLPTSTYQFHMLLFTYLQASCRSIYCPNTSLVSPGPSPNFSLSRYSQCSSPDRLSEPSLVQAPHLCLQDLLPTSACRDIAKQNMSSLAIN